MIDNNNVKTIRKSKRTNREIFAAKKRRNILYKKYGHFIGQSTNDLPEEHRAKVGGLRCFRQKWRVISGEKNMNLPKVRCGKVASKGSLFCRNHGGGNTKSLTTGSSAIRLFKNAYKGNLIDVFSAFLEDPNIMDHKRELATLRTVLLNYIDSLSNKDQDLANINICMGQIQDIMSNLDYSSEDKFFHIKQIMNSQQTLTDGSAIDRISKLIDSIGRAIERIDKLEKTSDYMLTAEGMKIMLRGVIDVITRLVNDESTIRDIKIGFASISLATGGDITKLRQEREPIPVSSSDVT